MSRPIPAGDYVEQFDPDLPRHRAWLLAVLEQLVAHEPHSRDWGKGSGDPVVATASRDWLLHHSHPLRSPTKTAQLRHISRHSRLS